MKQDKWIKLINLESQKEFMIDFIRGSMCIISFPTCTIHNLYETLDTKQELVISQNIGGQLQVSANGK